MLEISYVFQTINDAEVSKIGEIIERTSTNRIVITKGGQQNSVVVNWKEIVAKDRFSKRYSGYSPFTDKWVHEYVSVMGTEIKKIHPKISVRCTKRLTRDICIM